MTAAAIDPSVPPMPFVVAAWLGFSHERIVQGLQRGTIAAPPGAPPGWLPAWEGAAPADDVVPASDPAPEPLDAVPSTDSGTDEPPADAEPGEPAPADLRSSHRELVRAIDPSVDDALFDALWQSSGGDDATRGTTVRDRLWRTIGVTPSAEDGVDALSLAIDARGTRGTLVSLAEEGSAVLANRARSDPALLRALASLDAFAFVDVEGGAQPAIARFDPMNGDAILSDAWVDDRAKFLAWRSALGAEPGAAAAAPGAWRFVDRTQGEGATVTIGSTPGESNQVVFARDDGDAVAGGAAVDRLHGGAGDDMLDGAAGDDLVEGAGGDDTLSGSNGDDALDGGGGDDRLTGGQGADHLAGGSGHDTYVFARGEGVDVVDDTDGIGAIVLDGITLDGGETDVEYATESDGAGGTTLVVATGAEAAGGGAIRVRDWRDGDLGIHLAAAAGAGESGPTPALPVGGIEPDLEPAPSGPLPVLKPRVTHEPETMNFVREPGNESGMGWTGPDAAMPLGHAPACGTQADGGSGPVRSIDVARALGSGPAYAAPCAIASPPAFDPDALTAADVADALAGHAGDHDDAEAASLPTRLPWWMAHDAPRGIEPPDAPSHRGG